jgi:inactivated superfamily I helicase
VPGTLNSDLFLPNTLRRQLGLLDNDRRYARDAYALHVLLASRRELRLVAGRHGREGEPLVPSRLSFATDRKAAAARARAVFRRTSGTVIRIPVAIP